MIFCKVNKGLIDLIEEQAGDRYIIDVGCGQGLLGSMLPGIISIDLLPDYDNALIRDIVMADAAKFPMNDKCFPVFLRPCHGFFAEVY
jgi:hypothetical protein